MLSLERVSVTFNGGTPNEVRALQDLSLTVGRGEFVTIIGSNGAGKSTLFNAISGAVAVNAGRIMLDGQDITHMPEYRRSHDIGRVFQNPSLGTCPGLTIRENLSLAAIHGRAASLRRDVKARADSRFREQLARANLGLERRLDADVGLLSGGQRQAVTLTMATLSQPKLLLLDEHTAALDPNAAEQVIQLTEELAGSPELSVVMITHSMQQACRLGDRVLMMHKGAVVFDIAGAARQNLEPAELIKRFTELSSGGELSDRQLLG